MHIQSVYNMKYIINEQTNERDETIK